MIEESDAREGAERNSVFLFVKTFVKDDGTTYRHCASVTVQRDGNEISISSHYIKEKQLREKIKAGKVLYNATSLDASRQTPLENLANTDTGAPSTDKDTEDSRTVQENDGKFSLEEDM